MRSLDDLASHQEGVYYYHWIMGVLPTYRKRGIAHAMMDSFAEAARARNCHRLRVKTMNQYRSMLRLLIDCDYDIVNVEGNKIVFEKSIHPHVARSQ